MYSMDMTTCYRGVERFLYASVIVFIVQGHTSAPAHDASKTLEYVSTQYWEWKLREHPAFATFKGRHEYDHRLEEYTLSAFKRRKTQCEKFLRILDKIDPHSLNAQDRQTLAVLTADLDTYVTGYKWHLYGTLNPMNFLEGIYRSPGWIRAMPFITMQHYQRYMIRLQALAVQVSQITKLLQKAVKLRRTNHRVSMRNVISQLNLHLTLPNRTVFFWRLTPVELRNSNINQSHWPSLQAQALEIIEKKVQVAYRDMQRYLRNVYMKNTRLHYGVGAWAGGQEFYQACLSFHLSDPNVTAAQIHQHGLREVSRIKGLMQGIMKRVGFNGNLPAFFSHLRSAQSDTYYGRSKKELLEGYEDIVHNRIKKLLPKVIKDIPEDDIIIKPMPYDGPSGSYGNGVFYVNVRRPETRPIYTMVSLALHETNPGHHLQTVVNKRLPLPEFRRHLWGMKYYSIPFNFPWYTAYTEGWGLYAEFLGEEMGLYNTSALELFGRYSSEIFRACRLVIDTGIHAYNMSRKEAIKYLSEHTAIPITQITTEVDRYITWPGQACAYKMGEREILKMRRKAESQLGNLFDLREFNERVLRVGRAPMNLLEKVINNWISEVLHVGRVAASGCHVTSSMHTFSSAFTVTVIFYILST